MQSVTEILPNISYFTIADLYMYGCFIYLVLITIWSSIVGKFECIPREMDDMTFYVFLFCFFVIQFYFIFLIWEAKKLGKKKLTMGIDALYEYKKSIGNSWLRKPYAESMTKSKRYIYWDRKEAFDEGERTVLVGKTLRTEPPKRALVDPEEPL